MLKKTAGLFVAALLTATSARGGTLEELLPSVPLDELEHTWWAIANNSGIIKESIHYRELDGRYCVHAVLKTFHSYDSWNEYRSVAFFNDSCDAKLDHLFVNDVRTSTIPELHEQLDSLEDSSYSHERLIEEQNSILDNIIARDEFENRYKNLYEREASQYNE